jgi:hypothetical protein
VSARRELPGVGALASAPTAGGIVDVLTGQAPVVRPVPAGALSLEDARALSERIRQAARDVSDHVARLLQLVDQAIGGEAWLVLGYPSVAAYVVDVVEPMRLPAEQRRMVVGWLSGKGLSTRAIAPLLSVDQKTIVSDRRRLAAAAPAEENSSPARVTGLDGRSYPAAAPEQAPAQRPSLTVVDGDAVRTGLPLPEPETYQTAVLAVVRLLEQHGAITTDDWLELMRELDGHRPTQRLNG